MKKQAASFNQQVKDQSPVEILKKAKEIFNDEIIMASSLGAEDQLITDMIFKNNLSIPIFVLDTGRLNQETYDILDQTEKTYQFKFKLYFPESSSVVELVKRDGINGFYQGIEQRKACCHVRKVEPLKRALKNKKAWITGLRKEQAPTRKDLSICQVDEQNNCMKINPLLNWTETQVWEAIKKNQIPYNQLHDQNYPSIGCAPCTRAIKSGEDTRAGRWWWENPSQKECGLHKG